MSRKLPPSANLDHLKKQAKDILRDLRRRSPRSKLANAQHALAREYGFGSWTKLKAHVESLPPDYGFARYTPKARQALFYSRYEASQLASAEIEPEHVLLGLIRAGHGLTSRIFERIHLSLENVRARVADARTTREPLSSFAVIPFSDGTKQVLLYAIEESDRLKHHVVGTAHLLLGLLHREGSVARSILQNAGMRTEAVRDDIDNLLNE